MSIGATQVAGIVIAAETAFPLGVLVLKWGNTKSQSVNVFRSESTRSDSESDLAGVVPGLRGKLRLILSRCSPWTPPAQDDLIDLYTTAGVLVGSFVIIGHDDDPTGTVRSLYYGEDAV